MASITSNGANGHHKFTLTVTDKLENNSTSTNTSTVSFSFGISSLGGGWNWEQWGANITYVITINGTQYTGSIANYDGYSDVTLKSGSLTVAHNTDGNKTISFSFSVTDTSGQNYTCGNASARGTLALATIPRYLSITSLYISAKTETSAVVSWITSDPRDSTYYSFDNGSTWIGSATDGESLASDLKSGTFNIANLSANTTYNIKVKIKRTDSQLWTVSDAVTFTTYNYPHCTDSPNFTIGDNLTLSFYNPLSRNISIYLELADGRVIGGDTVTGTSIKGYSNEYWRGDLYASIPRATSGKYKVRVVYGSVTMTRDNGNTYSIRGNETPTINAFDYIDTNSSVVAITGNNLHIVQNKSTLQARFHQATANYGAGSIIKYVAECNGTTKESASYGTLDLGTVNSASDVNLKLTVYDSRGLSSSKTIKVDMVAYEAPKATVELKRLNNYEDETYLTVDGSISSVNGKNTMTVKYRYKLSGGSYGSFKTIGGGEEETLSLDKNNSYIFNVVVTDIFGETFNSEYVLNKGVFPLFIDTVKNSVGINCFPTAEKTLEVNGTNLLDAYKCEKNILLTTGAGLKITINSFGGDNDKASLIVIGADNASVTPVFKILRVKKNSSGGLTGFGELNLGLASEVTVSGNSIHIFATQWSFFTVKAPLGSEITLTNSAL